ncbi:glycosyltransferase family 4 protein [Micromonospora sp. DT81.3]|uniref:glycosyltransferase family 4 protein n=1 Tax=Actinomycetes TaxID=1760 RepID=UPI003CE77483
MRLRDSRPLVSGWIRRLATLAEALGHNPVTVEDEAGLMSALSRLVDARDRSQIWLALAVLTGRLPESSLVQETARRAEFDPAALFEAIRSETTAESIRWTVVVEQAAVLVDVSDTVSTTMTTGIQRVVREVAKRWLTRPGVRFVAWTDGWQAMRELEPDELARVRDGRARVGEDPPRVGTTVVVPWETIFVLPEVSAELSRAARLRSLGRFGRTQCTAICYDLIPVTSSETLIATGLTGAFAHYLSALKFFTRVCTISQATAIEYNGWRVMLRGAGLVGPDVVPVLLPTSAGGSSPSDLDAARERLVVGTMPLVLVVGSHEPRKNHLAVLHAAELLWREGRRFSLCFIGGNAWRSEEFHERLGALQAAGRPVESISRAGDSLLWAAYRVARFTVFPSINEGFGLPVAESLAVGTPVITSEFGSTREIAESGGAMLVDPRDDDQITRAMRALLSDDDILERLRDEAHARPTRTWDDYADLAWAALVPDGGPLPRSSDSLRV